MAAPLRRARREPRGGAARGGGRARVLRRPPPEELRELVADAMEPVLRPLVYAEPLRLVERHRNAASPSSSSPRRCRRSWRRSPTTSASTARSARSARSATASTRAAPCARCTPRPRRCLRAMPRARVSISRSAPRTPTATPTCPFLEAVGHPVAVNPDRALRRIAGERGWPVLEFRAPCSADEGSPGSGRSASPGDAELWEHFDDAEQRGKHGHGHSRIPWLEALEGYDPAAEPSWSRTRPASSAGTATARSATSCSAPVDSRAARRRRRAHARLVVCDRTFPTGMLGHYVRRLADGGLVAVLTATSPRAARARPAGPKLAGTNPLAIGIPSSDGDPLVADVSMGAVTWGDVLAGLAPEDELVPFGGEQWHKAFALALGLQLLVDALVASRGTARCCSSRGRRPIRSGAAPRPASASPGSRQRLATRSRIARAVDRRTKSARGDSVRPAQHCNKTLAEHLVTDCFEVGPGRVPRLAPGSAGRRGSRRNRPRSRASAR